MGLRYDRSMSPRRIIRTTAVWSLALFLLPILIAVFSEFPIEWVKEQGYYAHPSAKIDAMIAFVDHIILSTWFQWSVIGIAAFTVGAWLDYFLRIREENKAGTLDSSGNFTPEQIQDLSLQIERTKEALNAIDEGVTHEGFHEATALSIKLMKLGIRTPFLPELKDKIEYETFGNDFRRYLEVIAPHIRDGDIKQTSYFAASAVSILFENRIASIDQDIAN